MIVFLVDELIFYTNLNCAFLICLQNDTFVFVREYGIVNVRLTNVADIRRTSQWRFLRHNDIITSLSQFGMSGFRSFLK